jgi:hypothetical protein
MKRCIQELMYRCPTLLGWQFWLSPGQVTMALGASMPIGSSLSVNIPAIHVNGTLSVILV